MEEDIKILEEILNRDIEDTEGTKIMKKAIERLIARNKELTDKGIELATNIDVLETDLKKLKEKNKKLQEDYKRLSVEAQATAFDDQNQDTEILLRVLLKQNQITLDEKGNYQRKDFDWEENLTKMGLCKKREKTFIFSDDDVLDEYTKQLESQLKEHNELKKIFKKYYVVGNETIYDGCIKMQDEIDKYKELQKKLDKENIPIQTLLGELDRLEDIEDDRDCNYIPKSKVREKIEEIFEILDKIPNTIIELNGNVMLVKHDIANVFEEILED